VVRGRYASLNLDYNTQPSSYYDCRRSKFFCSTACESEWLNEHMTNIEQGRPIEFIRHRRESLVDMPKLRMKIIIMAQVILFKGLTMDS
jgi:hypothetical protein